MTAGLDAASDSHRVRAEIEPGLTTRADPTVLHQVLAHPLDNALKYSPPGGDVTLMGRRTADGVAVAMISAGVDLPPASDIFEVFQRGDGTQIGSAPGTGLGLHVVRNLVEAMKGSVATHSDPEAGTTLIVNLRGPGAGTGPGSAEYSRLGLNPPGATREGDLPQAAT